MDEIVKLAVDSGLSGAVLIVLWRFASRFLELYERNMNQLSELSNVMERLYNLSKTNQKLSNQRLTYIEKKIDKLGDNHG